jgi:hypothetical protein
MEKSYDILFSGQLVDGQEQATVRANIAELFKASGDTLEKLFSGQPQLIKRGVDKTTAAKYRNAMHRAGAVALIKVSTQAAPDADGGPAAPAAEPATQSKPQTMAERVAALAGEAPSQPDTSEAPKATSTSPSPDATPAGEDSGLSLAPAGADVLRDDERETVIPVAVDTSAMNVDESGADIPSLPRFDDIPPPPDVSGLSMGELGEDIPNLPSNLEPLDIDTSAIDLAPEGTDFSDCMPAPVAIKEPDLSGIELAPEGSDLLENEHKSKDAPAPPNVDHLQLSEDGPAAF